MRRILIATTLLLAVVGWVGLLSLLSGEAGTPGGKPAEDGSLVTVKLVDKSNFDEGGSGEISLRMDILDAAGKPILGLSKHDVRVIECDVPVKVKAFKGPGTQPINVILVIDVSGSMEEAKKMQGARKAALAAVNELVVERDRIGVIAFDDAFETLQPLARLTPEVKSSCSARIRELRPDGGTSIAPPVVAALESFQREGPDGLKVLLVMTDGEDMGLSAEVDRIAERSAETGVPTYTIGFGDLSSQAELVLQELAGRCEASYHRAPTGEELAGIYRAQIREMTQEFLTVYDSPYPQRDGLPRPVAVKINAPAGMLEATTSYQFPGVISTAGHRKRPDQPQAASGPGWMELAIFCVLLSLLGIALAVSVFTGRGSPSAVSGAATAASPFGQRSGMRAIPAPPPPADPDVLTGKPGSTPPAGASPPRTKPPPLPPSRSGPPQMPPSQQPRSPPPTPQIPPPPPPKS